MTARARRLGLVALALVVVLAGCGAAGTTSPTGDGATATERPATGADGTPTAEPTQTATPGADDEAPPDDVDAVTVVGELPADVNATRIYERVQRLSGIEATSDVRVTVRSAEAGEGTFRLPPESFVGYMGMEAPPGGGSAAGVTTSGSAVTLYTDGNWSANRTRLVLAHEFLHTLQLQQGARRAVYSPGVASNQRQVVGMVIEGTASYVHRVYLRRYQNRSADYLTPFNGSSAFGKYAYGRYALGARYVETRLNDSQRLPTVFEDPPLTTEQLMHGDPPGEEPPRPLSVDASTGDRLRAVTEGTKGELILNAVLSTELSDERAWHAAAGWGADRLVRFEDDGEAAGYAWALRWDSPAEAEAFAAALERFLDARADRADGRWEGPDHAYRVERVGEDTVVLLVGDDPFVGGASVDGTAGNVSVSAAA